VAAGTYTGIPVSTQDAMRLANTVFLVDGATPLKYAYTSHDFDFGYDRH
jgi:hypothetical protein